MTRASRLWAAGAILAAMTTAKGARAEEDVAKMYDLGVQATATVAKGGSGTVTVRIAPKAGAEFHKEAPLKVQLEAPKNIALSKDKLTRDDVKMDGAAATLEVPFTANDAGKGTIEAKLSFMICTDKVCARQERTASLPVAVR
jgi:hypothetical protein